MQGGTGSKGGAPGLEDPSIALTEAPALQVRVTVFAGMVVYMVVLVVVVVVVVESLVVVVVVACFMVAVVVAMKEGLDANPRC